MTRDFRKSSVVVCERCRRVYHYASIRSKSKGGGPPERCPDCENGPFGDWYQTID